MRILMSCYEYPPLGGGGARVVHGLSRELVRSGHEIDIVTMGYGDLERREVIDGVNIYRTPCLRRSKSICHIPEMATYLASALPRIVKLVNKRKYDLNHTHFIFPDGVLSYLVKKMTGLSYVITAHGSDIPGYNPNRFKRAHKLLSPVWKKVVNDVDRVIFPSDSLRSLYLEHGGIDKTAVIPNGITTTRIRAASPKGKRILVVTRMFERKGVQYFLKALDGLEHDHEVNIVGDGPYLPKLRKMAGELGLDVNFRGWLDNQSSELIRLYETSDIFVFTSEVENFPIVLLEAMAAGTAIVTTKGTGCQEVVGDASLLVEPRNHMELRKALDRLTGDPILRKRLGGEARERLEKRFSWGAVAEQHAELYEEQLQTARAMGA